MFLRSILREIDLQITNFNKTLPDTRWRDFVTKCWSSSSTELTQQPKLVQRQQEAISVLLESTRVHKTLLEQYHAAAKISQEERVRLTARRVGLDLPEMLKGL